jgi:hypothetical protein
MNLLTHTYCRLGSADKRKGLSAWGKDSDVLDTQWSTIVGQNRAVRRWLAYDRQT